MQNLDIQDQKNRANTQSLLKSDPILSASKTLPSTDAFVNRHIGPNPDAIEQMLNVLGISTIDSLIEQTVPAAIWLNQPLQLPAAQSEYAALAQLKE
ncbi:MAG: hypothetical protein F6K55_24590, partial [Moorea sp. SIO4A3]|nr:hypothetical protein [Moorena sp. SIO4A3]